MAQAHSGDRRLQGQERRLNPRQPGRSNENPPPDAGFRQAEAFCSRQGARRAVAGPFRGEPFSRPCLFGSNGRTSCAFEIGGLPWTLNSVPRGLGFHKTNDMTIEESIHIRVSKEVLFDYLMDVKNRKDYIPALEEVIMIDPPPIRKGSKYIEVANIGGMRLETTYEVIRFQLNERITAKTQKSIFPIQADLSLEENKNGTLIMIQLDFKLAGPFRLASRIVSGIVRQQARGILDNIKHELENS